MYLLETTEGVVWLIYILSILIGIWILYEIVSTASRSAKILAESKKQTNLLELIAKASGVTPEDIAGAKDTTDPDKSNIKKQYEKEIKAAQQ